MEMVHGLKKSFRSARALSNNEDDRAQFEQEKRLAAKRMAADRRLEQKSRELFAHADTHDFSYQWSWLGVPVIQVPTDIVLLQEAIWETKPTLIIETGIGRGGSSILFASMLQLLGRGTVLAIDIDIRDHNRKVIEGHFLAPRITLLEGDSLSEQVIAVARGMAEKAERVMVVLDSNHTHDHVLGELNSYAQLVTPGCHLVVFDTIIDFIPPHPTRTRPWGPRNSPLSAIEQFLEQEVTFEMDSWFNQRTILSSCPSGFLRRKS